LWGTAGEPSLEPWSDGVEKQVIDGLVDRDNDVDVLRRRNVGCAERRETHAERANMMDGMRLRAPRVDERSRLRSHENREQRGDPERPGEAPTHDLILLRLANRVSDALLGQACVRAAGFCAAAHCHGYS
jgi:hypothetical protein